MPEEKEKFNFRSFWVKIWDLISPSRKQIVLILVLVSALEAVRLVGPYILKLIIDRIMNFNVEDLGLLIFLATLMFLVNQLLAIFDYFADRKIFDVLVDVVTYLSNNALHKMVFLSLGYHEKENTGNKVIKITRGVDKIDNLFFNFFWEVAPTIFQFVFTTGLLFWINWTFGVAILIFVPAFVFLTFMVNRLAYSYRKKRFDAQEEAAGLMTQSIININTVKSFVQEMREYRKFSRAMENVKSNVLKEIGYILKFNVARNFVIDFGRAVILFLGIYLVLENQITVGSLVFVYTVSEKALLSLFRISRLYDRIMESAEAVERLHELSREELDIKNSKHGLKPKNVEGSIRFENVSYTYPESSKKALDGAGFNIHSGCVTALVGPSGGGKTTVARMIYRHYDPDKGGVFLDGENLKKYDLYTFRRFISIVPQEVEVFNTTVRENISYAKPNASLSEIEAAAKIANAEEFISQLSEGYDTMVGERGIKLSGGQRQRLGIARAILANPRILIFDEATSSLDSYSEKLIQDAMEKVRKNRTVIVIAHRLSTIKKADKIIVLEEGKVAEQGSHFELAKSGKGLYQKLLRLQEMGEVSE
jgi:ABC-type multidrug transport system fused ATPase/permease subunit